MTASIEAPVIDGGLSVLDTLTSFISVTSSEPTTIAIAATSGLLGFKNWGAGAAFGAPSDSPPLPGRQVASVAISDGTITTSGTASWWAAYAAGTLHAHGTLSGAQVVTAGNTFTLASFTIKIPGF
jgi:hypothetical protein